MSSTEYVCTHAEKRKEVDDFEHGCDPNTSQFVWEENPDIKADSLPALVDEMKRYFDIKLDDIWLPVEGDEDVTRIGYNQLETNKGKPPTKKQVTEWQAGRLKLWLADYDFLIEKRSGVPQEEFRDAGIKFHS
jgi:hypothetical protein